MSEYPMTEKVCEYFDCRVIWSLDDDPSWLRTCCYLGDVGDMSVGIFPYMLTPEFYLRSDIEDFCNSEKGQRLIESRAKQVFVDYPFDGVGVFE